MLSSNANRALCYSNNAHGQRALRAATPVLMERVRYVRVAIIMDRQRYMLR